MTAFYAFSARNLQDYIFSSSRLRDIAAASDLLEQLTNELPDRLLTTLNCQTGKVLFSAAGSFRLQFDAEEEATRFAAHIPPAVHGWMPGLDFVQALRVGAHTHIWRDLTDDMNSARNWHRTALPEAGPWSLRSPRTGRAAVQQEQYAGETELLDQPTSVKRLLHEERRWGLGHRLITLVNRDDPRSFGYRRWATEMEEIAPEGTALGIVHADGNGFGAILKSAAEAIGHLEPSRQTAIWGKFSRALTLTIESAFVNAFKSLDWTDQSGYITARPVVLGGDDLTIILPAPKAVPFAQAYCTNFNRACQIQFSALTSDEPALTDIIAEPLTASAGIAIVHRNHPFHAAYRLSKSLCRFAKTNMPGYPAIAFHRATGTLEVDYFTELQHSLTDRQGRRLSLNPYALNRDKSPYLDDLLALAKALRELPRGPWRKLAGKLQQGADPAPALERIYIVAEDSPETAAAMDNVRDALLRLGCDPRTAFSGNLPQQTPLHDALTLMAAAVAPLDGENDG